MAVLTLLAVIATFAYASDDHSCQDGTCKTTVTTQGMSLLMTQKHLSPKKLVAISPGDPECPCLEESQLDTNDGTFPEKIYEKIENGKAVKTLPECDGSTTKEWSFPKNLGIGSCTSMEKLAPFCGTGDKDSPRRWKTDWMCKQQFCHVDPSKCKKRMGHQGQPLPWFGVFIHDMRPQRRNGTS